MKYQFMEQQRQYHRVEKMASVLKVSRGGYYAWRKRGTSRRAQEDEKLVTEISDIQENVAKYRYGSPRVTEELHRRDLHVGHNRVARLMRGYYKSWWIEGMNEMGHTLRTTTKSSEGVMYAPQPRYPGRPDCDKHRGDRNGVD